MAKIVLIGAGSGFGARFGTDIMASEVLRESTICLCDIHEGRLAAVTSYLQKMIDEYHLPTKLESSTDRRALLPDADFVVTSIAAGGGAYYGEPYRSEIEIPRKYGIEQTVGDSYSVGSTFRFLRTAPVQLAVCRDMEQLCPNAYLLNHTNPMSALTMIHSLGSRIRNVGLCHGVVGTADGIAAAMGLTYDDLAYKVAGMNHLAWFLELKDKKTGEDLYPRFLEALTHTEDEKIAKFLIDESVRVETMRQFGFYPTESNRHDSEYMPYFRRTPELLAEYHLAPKPPVPDEQPSVRSWVKPITIARHAYGDIYKCTEYRVPCAGSAELLFKDAEGKELFHETVFDFKCPGVLMGTYNKDDSIQSFARACFNFALATKQDLWFSAKDTISKKYDHTFKDIFQEIFDAEYKEKFEKAGITYFYTLIDDAVARVIRSEGGFIWACKNYDGDVMSDMVATAFGSLAMMTSVLVSPDGNYEYEAAHGTVTRHYYKHLQGETTSTNSMATLFAWTGALKKRGEMDELPELVAFGEKLEQASLKCISDGFMTKDLALLADMENKTVLSTEGFILKVKEYLDAAL